MVAQSTRKVDGGRIPGAAAVPQCIEVMMEWQLADNTVCHSALHGRNAGSFNPSVASANNLFVALSGSMNTHLNTFLFTGFKFNAVSVRDMTDPTLPVFRSSAAAVPMGATATALPNDVNLVLTESLVARGRGAQGRIYIPGWNTGADTGNGVILPGVMTAVNAMGTDWMANLLAASLVACVAKPARQEYIGVTGATHPARDAHTVDVSAYICKNNEWDTQRRRGH